MKYIDLDFFQPERDRIALKRKKMIPLVLLAALLITMCLSIIGLVLSEKNLETDLAEISKVNLEIEDDIIELEKNIDDVTGVIDRYENGASGNSTLSTGDGVSINEIKEEHLNAILASTPKEAFYSKILIEENVLTLEGYTDSTQVVAKIVYNLEQTGYFEDVLISKISTSEDSGYVFTINANVKE